MEEPQPRRPQPPHTASRVVLAGAASPAYVRLSWVERQSSPSEELLSRAGEDRAAPRDSGWGSQSLQAAGTEDSVGVKEGARDTHTQIYLCLNGLNPPLHWC